METFDGIAGRCLGYLGLFLIGSLARTQRTNG